MKASGPPRAAVDGSSQDLQAAAPPVSVHARAQNQERTVFYRRAGYTVQEAGDGRCDAVRAAWQVARHLKQGQVHLKSQVKKRGKVRVWSSSRIGIAAVFASKLCQWG